MIEPITATLSMLVASMNSTGSPNTPVAMHRAESQKLLVHTLRANDVAAYSL